MLDWFVRATDSDETIVRERHPFQTPGAGLRYVDLQITGLDDGFTCVWWDVTDRTMHEARLREAKEQAEHASVTRSRFLSTLSHELRTPLNAVIGLADLIESEVVGPINETQKDYMSRIRNSAWYQQSMIEDILSFTRAEAGRVQLRLETIDLGELAREVAEMFDQAVRKKGLELRIEISSDRLAAQVDPGKLRQIMTNLVGNAIKYTTKGSITIRIETAEDEIRLSVHDTGIGIDDTQLEEIFEPFVQVDPSNTTAAGGAGLGLAVCRRLAELMNGSVEVDSTLGSGSVFTVRIPFHKPIAGD
jgi:signal transduction histidine kinase